MNRFVFSNFMVGELLDNILAATTEIRISPSVAAKLQLFNENDQLEARLTFWDGQQDPEIVGCISNPQTGTLIVNRAQEDTTARAWSAGTQVRCALTAAVINQALFASINTQELLQQNYLSLLGGTVSGPIILPSQDPTNANEAARKAYVDNIQGNKLPLNGGTMLGAVNMNGNRILSLPAAVAGTEPVRKAEWQTGIDSQTAIFSDRSGGMLTAGAGNAFTAASSATYTLTTGTMVRVTLHADMQDSATFALNTLDAKPIQRRPGVAVSQGDALAGSVVDLIYNATQDAWILANQNNDWETGDVKFTMRSTVGPGWRLADDGTIGGAGSAATFASAAAKQLFLLLWSSMSDSLAPVSGGRGVTALAD